MGRRVGVVHSSGRKRVLCKGKELRNQRTRQMMLGKT